MRALTSTLLLLLAFPLHAAAAKAPAWAEPYDRGVAAAQRKAWSEAADAMEKAIAANGQEQLNVNNGKAAINYLPHYWLGVARLNLGDTKGALASLKKSEAQGVIQRTDQYAAFRAALARAQAGAASAVDNKARKPADDAVARAVVAQTLALGAGASRKSEYQLADRKLEQALASLKGNPSATQIQSATKLADEATKLYESVSKAPVRPPVVAGGGTTSSPARPAVPPPPEDRDPAELARIEQQLQQLEAAAASGLARNSGPKMQQLARDANRNADGWRAEIGTGVPGERLAVISNDIGRMVRLIEAIRPDPVAGGATGKTGPIAAVTPTPPVKTEAPAGARLRSAFEALSEGRLDESERILDELIGNGGGVGAAYALRGCVRYTRALLGEGQPLIAAAQSDFITAVRMDPKIKLDGRYFSPKIVAFFDQTKAATR